MKYVMQDDQPSKQPTRLPFGKPCLVVFLIALVPACIFGCRLLAKDESLARWMIYSAGIPFGVTIAFATGVVGQVLHDLFGFSLDGTFRSPQLLMLLGCLGAAVLVGLLAVKFLPEWVWESQEIRMTIYALILIEAIHRGVSSRRARN